MTAFSRALDAILKDNPGVGDVHVETALGNSGKPKRKPVAKLPSFRPDSNDAVVSFRLRADKHVRKRFADLLEWIGKQAAGGTGITISAEDNGGDKGPEAYLDGDGSDRLYDVKVDHPSIGKSEVGAHPWSIPATVVKSAPTGRELWAWASVVEKDGQPVIDSQGDIIDPADLERAADDFMTKSRDVGLMHQTTGHGRVVQSMVFSCELQKALGIDLGKVGWLVKMEITDPAMQKRVASGELRELSIGGRGIRTEI